MHPTERGLLDDILAHPGDDVPRLVYADWLDDQQSEPSPRAEFIRVQCELAGIGKEPTPFVLDPRYLSSDDYGRKALREDERAIVLRRRENELIRSHLWTVLRDELPAGVFQEFDRWEHKGNVVTSKRDDDWQLTFTRGFVSSVRCTLADWIGTSCERCGGNGFLGGVAPGQSGWLGAPDCPACHGTGRQNAHGRAIVQCQPVEVVEVSDRSPLAPIPPSSQQWHWQAQSHGHISYSQSPAPWFLPDEIANLIGTHSGGWTDHPTEIEAHSGGWTDHATEADARAALSTALLRWAKSAALKFEAT